MHKNYLQFASRTALYTLEKTLVSGDVTKTHEGVWGFPKATQEALTQLNTYQDLFTVILCRQNGSVLVSSDLSIEQGSKYAFFSALNTQALVEKGTEYHSLEKGTVHIAAMKMRMPFTVQEEFGVTRLFENAVLVLVLETVELDTVYRDFKLSFISLLLFVFVILGLLFFLTMLFFKRRAKALRAGKLENFLHTLTTALPDGLIGFSHGEIIFANKAAKDIYDKNLPLVGNTVQQLTENSVLVNVLLGSATQPIEDGLEAFSWKQWDYYGKYLETFCIPLGKDSLAEYLVVVRDRSHLKELEDGLLEAEKLASIGMMAAGLAHEIRNPLASIRGFAEFFAKKFTGKNPEETYAKTMVHESDRLNQFVTELLYLANPRLINPIVVDLPQVMAEIRTLVQFDLERNGITFTTDLAEQYIWADFNTIKQVLINLILNAIDALKNLDSKEKTVKIYTYTTKEGVWVSVTDSGHGMSPADLKKAFDPFFTKKPTGTGLGLPIVRKAMKDHGGEAKIISPPGTGLTVSLLFPHKP